MSVCLPFGVYSVAILTLLLLDQTGSIQKTRIICITIGRNNETMRLSSTDYTRDFRVDMHTHHVYTFRNSRKLCVWVAYLN